METRQHQLSFTTLGRRGTAGKSGTKQSEQSQPPELPWYRDGLSPVRSSCSEWIASNINPGRRGTEDSTKQSE